MIPIPRRDGRDIDRRNEYYRFLLGYHNRRSFGGDMSLPDIFFHELLDSLHDGLYFVDCDRRILFWNKGAEELTGYTKEETEGVCCPESNLMHVNERGEALCMSECPLMKAVRDGKPSENEVYLRHKEGHRVPVLVRCTPIFDESGEVKGAAEIFFDVSQQQAERQRLVELAMLCPLTGVGNRRFTAITLDEHMEELERYGWPFAVLFIDIDHFKVINDQYGHEIGDNVLVMVANTLVNSLRPFDFLGRWGGEEFVAILSNVECEQAREVAERCRVLIENSYIKHGESTIRVTLSIGVTTVHTGETAGEVIARADHLMYLSKSHGRNCVSIEDASSRV